MYNFCNTFFFQHRDTDDNNPDVAFEFTSGNMKVRFNTGSWYNNIKVFIRSHYFKVNFF